MYDGFVQVSFFDPPQDEYRLYSLYIMPFAYLPPEFVTWLLEHIPPWEQPADFASVSLEEPSEVPPLQRRILAQLPAAYEKHLVELAGRRSGFPALPPATPKRGIVGFGTASPEED